MLTGVLALLGSHFAVVAGVVIVWPPNDIVHVWVMVQSAAYVAVQSIWEVTVEETLQEPPVGSA